MVAKKGRNNWEEGGDSRLDQNVLYMHVFFSESQIGNKNRRHGSRRSSLRRGKGLCDMEDHRRG